MVKKLSYQLSVLPVEVNTFQQADSAIQGPFSLSRYHHHLSPNWAALRCTITLSQPNHPRSELGLFIRENSFNIPSSMDNTDNFNLSLTDSIENHILTGWKTP
jgi:hypothetical protein